MTPLIQYRYGGIQKTAPGLVNQGRNLTTDKKWWWPNSNASHKYRGTDITSWIKDETSTKTEIKKFNKTISESWSELRVFKKPGHIYLFSKRAYNVSIYVGLSLHKMRSVQCIFDTGAVSKLIRKYLLETDWFQNIQAASMPSLRSTVHQKFSVVETVLLHVKKEDARIPMVFGVVRNLKGPISLGSSFIDRCG